MRTIQFLLVLLLGVSSVAVAQTATVIDTDFSKGQLTHIQQIKYKDLVRFHGHSCDGLLEGMQALQLGLKVLYPDGIVDRTNTRAISKSSPCLTDAAIYLTGGRYQYHTFYVDNGIEGLYILQRIDNGQTVTVIRNAGVKPPEIDSLGSLAIEQKLSINQLNELKRLEEKYAKFLMRTPPKLNFTVKHITQFNWQPVLQSNFIKTDIINKNKKD